MDKSWFMTGLLNRATATTVRRLRTSKGLSQEELAQLADLDRTYISGIERSTRNITLRSLERIVTALEVPMLVFLKELLREVERE